MALDVHKPKGFRKAWRGGVDLTRKITVCDACLCACCWQGSFYCEQAKTAGTRDMTLAELHQLNLGTPRESVEYWFKDPASGRIDEAGLEAFRRNYDVVVGK